MKYPFAQELPPANDPRWALWTAPLATYLVSILRTWDELQVWRESNNIQEAVFLQMLAWLSFRGLAAYHTETGCWYGGSPKLSLDEQRFPKTKDAGSNPAGDATFDLGLSA